jgi:two-component system, NtrC family, response regulator PilR
MQDSSSQRLQKIPRVLVVDDEADLRELLEITLVGMGLDVDCAATVTQAKELLSTNRYSLCLTDMRLPDGDGLSLVASVASMQQEVPVAVITAYGSAENAVAALKAGAFDYLSKPIALDSLRSLVRAALKIPVVSTAITSSNAGARDEASEQAVAAASMLGTSAQMLDVRASIARLARSTVSLVLVKNWPRALFINRALALINRLSPLTVAPFQKR